MFSFYFFNFSNLDKRCLLCLFTFIVLLASVSGLARGIKSSLYVILDHNQPLF